jgi:hypothetical protein
MGHEVAWSHDGDVGLVCGHLAELSSGALVAGDQDRDPGSRPICDVLQVADVLRRSRGLTQSCAQARPVDVEFRRADGEPGIRVGICVESPAFSGVVVAVDLVVQFRRD